jgi:hypothetical protein
MKNRNSQKKINKREVILIMNNSPSMNKDYHKASLLTSMETLFFPKRPRQAKKSSHPLLHLVSNKVTPLPSTFCRKNCNRLKS